MDIVTFEWGTFIYNLVVLVLIALFIVSLVYFLQMRIRRDMKRNVQLEEINRKLDVLIDKMDNRNDA